MKIRKTVEEFAIITVGTIIVAIAVFGIIVYVAGKKSSFINHSDSCAIESPPTIEATIWRE